MTDGCRIGWLVGLVLSVALVYWLMREGWKWRGTLQSDLPERPPPRRKTPGPAKLSMSGRYHGSTTAGQWLDRIVAHGLGTRSRVELHADGRGTGRRTPRRHRLLHPGRGTARGPARQGHRRRLEVEGGLLVITWAYGDKLIDSGFRSDRAAEDPSGSTP